MCRLTLDKKCLRMTANKGANYANTEAKAARAEGGGIYPH